MTLHATLFYPIPAETARVAHAAFPNGTRIMHMRDALGPLFTNPDVAHLFDSRGRPAEAPARLALVLVVQTLEQLSDVQAADAVRGRVEWKYALGLPLDDPGFDASILRTFRTRLIQGDASELLLDRMLQRLQDADLLTARTRQRTDSTHVHAAIRTMTRLTMVAETLRHALNDLATLAPTWLRTHMDPAWADRYTVRVEEYRLPKGDAERQALIRTIGQDGFALVAMLHAADAPADLRTHHAIVTLQQMWWQQ